MGQFSCGQGNAGLRFTSMLWTIAVILFVLWLIGWLGFHVLGAAIHILVILAVIFVILAIVRRA